MIQRLAELLCRCAIQPFLNDSISHLRPIASGVSGVCGEHAALLVEMVHTHVTDLWSNRRRKAACSVKARPESRELARVLYHAPFIAGSQIGLLGLNAPSRAEEV